MFLKNYESLNKKINQSFKTLSKLIKVYAGFGNDLQAFNIQTEFHKFNLFLWLFFKNNWVLIAVAINWKLYCSLDVPLKEICQLVFPHLETIEFFQVNQRKKGDGSVATENRKEENYAEAFLIFPIEWISNERKFTRNLHKFFGKLSEKQTPEDGEETAQVVAYDIYLL